MVIIILYEMFLLVYFQWLYLLGLFAFACLLILRGLKVKNYLKNILIIEHIKMNIKMDIKSLEIKNKTNYNINNISYIDDFNVNSLRAIKKESRIDANIYYIRCALNPDDDDTIMPLYFFINDLIGYMEEIDGSNDKYLIIVNSLRNKNIISVKIKDYDKFRFNFDIDLPLDKIIEFCSLLINVSCVIEKDHESYPEIYLDECSYVKYNPGPIKTLFPKNMGINILPAKKLKLSSKNVYNE